MPVTYAVVMVIVVYFEVTAIFSWQIGESYGHSQRPFIYLFL
jgi:hypothetical protein